MKKAVERFWDLSQDEVDMEIEYLKQKEEDKIIGRIEYAKTKERQKVALRMLKAGMEVEKICKFTKLARKEVEALSRKLSNI